MDINPTKTNTCINKNINFPSYNAVQLNLQQPTANFSMPNIIYDYPQANGQIYYQPAQQSPATTNNITKIPSGIDDYNNYIEVDKSGNEITSVKYMKDGASIIQKIKTKSPDGTMLEKTLENSPSFKKSNIIITDKNGKQLLSKEKTYQKINDNNAQTIVDGEIYNISGLQGNIITVENNGKIVQLDLNKMLNRDVKILKPKVSPNGFPIRETKITEQEKENLFNRIKSLSGDDLFRLSKSVEHIQFLDEKSHEAFFVEDGKTLLLSPKDWENSHTVTIHELGHAINHYKTKNLLSDDKSYTSIREYEKQNFKQNTNMTKGDKFFYHKFMFGNPDFYWKDTVVSADEDKHLRDESFAECYNNLNTMDILHYDDDVLPLRTLSLFKYLPKTMVEVERMAHI